MIKPWGLRITVALGVALGIALGAFRIVSGTPLYIYILVGYVVVILQTFTTPKQIIALAYDSGGVTTSTVTVPLVAALGLGLLADADSTPANRTARDVLRRAVDETDRLTAAFARIALGQSQCRNQMRKSAIVLLAER